MNSFPATQAVQVTEITVTEKGESTITIVNSSGVPTSQTLSAGLQSLVNRDLTSGDSLIAIRAMKVIEIR